MSGGADLSREGMMTFGGEVMNKLIRCLPTNRRDDTAVDALQARFRELSVHYRQLIRTVPSDLPGAPLREMTLTKRHEWVDSYILKPVARIKEALSEESRPLLSTWPEFMGSPPEIDADALAAELEKLEILGKYLWMNTRIRRKANVSVGWEIKFEIVRAVAGVLADIAPELTPSRGTYDKERKAYVGRFPEAITIACREISGFDDEGVDRQIADFVEEYRDASKP
jgi:hypothetical protein